MIVMKRSTPGGRRAVKGWAKQREEGVIGRNLVGEVAPSELLLSPA